MFVKSYNYNIKEENLISDLKLLELFGVSEIDVEEAITSTFQKFYRTLGGATSPPTAEIHICSS